MEEIEPLISVIVPVYKVEKYLEKCVNSILTQTLSNLEVILVDDGSPDRCPQMCDRFACLDHRVTVLHQKNAGLAAARNAGLSIARGAYIGFVDSDDYIAPTMYQELYDAIQREHALVSVCNYISVDEDGVCIAHRCSHLKSGVMSGKAMVLDLYSPYCDAYVVSWNKLYHRSIFADNRFEVGKQNEDTRIFGKLFYQIDTIVFIEAPLYFYLIRADSIMNQKATVRKFDHAEALYECFLFFYQQGESELLATAETWFFSRLKENFYLLDASDKKHPRVSEMLHLHKNALRILWKENCLSPNILFRSILFYISPTLYHFFRPE